MANKVVKTFLASSGNTTFTPPAEVTAVRVYCTYPLNPISMSQSGDGTVATDTLGNTFVWGFQSAGNSWQAIGTNASTSLPVSVIANNIIQTVVESASASYLTSSGLVYSSGANTSGQLGNGSTTPISSAVALAGSNFFRSIYAGSLCRFGITTANALYAWGLNGNGQLGNGNVTPQSSPVAVLGGLSFTNVFPNMLGSTFGLTPAGALYAWGINGSGQLGIGNVTPQSSPIAVLGGHTFTQVVAVGNANQTNPSILALDSAGSAWAWGINTHGQLGIGNVTPQSSPIAVLGGLTFTQIAGCGNTFFGLTSAGTLYSWGFNQAGQLGNGNVTPQSSPVAVLGGLSFKQVVNFGLEGFTALGLTTTGSAYAWGTNTLGPGELGNGNSAVTAVSSPTAVVGGLTFSSLYAAPLSVANSNQGVFCMGLTAAGSLYSWGANVNGELGNGTVTTTSSPVAVSFPTQIAQVAKQSPPAVLSVTPGTSYAITVNQGVASFGTTPVAVGTIASMTVEFDQ